MHRRETGNQEIHAPNRHGRQMLGHRQERNIVTSIEIPRDDLGTLDLKLKNATSEAVKPTVEVQPYPAIGNENQIREIVREQFTPKEQRRKKERRNNDRRQHQEPVLLDTRSQRDRRQSGRRRSDENHDIKDTQEVPLNKGFDAYV